MRAEENNSRDTFFNLKRFARAFFGQMPHEMAPAIHAQFIKEAMEQSDGAVIDSKGTPVAKAKDLLPATQRQQVKKGLRGREVFEESFVSQYRRGSQPRKNARHISLGPHDHPIAEKGARKYHLPL